MQKRDFKGIWIPKEVWLSKELTLQEKVFFVEIDSLDNEKGCFASNGYFADFFGISKTRVSLVIKSLINKGYITSEIEYKEGTKQILNRVIKVCYIPPLTKVKCPMQEKLKENNTSNNTMNKYSPEIFDFVVSFQNYVSSSLGNMAPEVTDSSTKKACDTVRLLIEKNGWKLEQIKKVMRWAVQDSFWSKNARSLGQLREKSNKNGLMKFQNIYAKWEEEFGQSTSGPTVVGGARVHNPDGSINPNAIM